MNLLQALNLITAEPKYYAGKMPQATASAIVRNIRASTAKQSTIERFMSAFGYSMVKEAEWDKG